MTTVYCTVPRDEAEEIVETLLEERLVACVNSVSCTSTYRWEGEVHLDEEVLLLAKTTAEAYDDLVERLVAIHPYDVPCVERFDEDHVVDSFRQWRADAVDTSV